MSLKPIEKIEREFIIEKRYGEIVREEWEPTTDIKMTEKINELIEIVNEQSEIIKTRELILRNIIESLKSFSEIIKISLNYDL